MWICTDCSVVVSYGGLFAGLRRCANTPNLMCPQGTVPTFTWPQETWQCATTCNNGLYDRVYINGTLVCVPC